jgi:Tol biopolymer transport system component
MRDLLARFLALALVLVLVGCQPTTEKAAPRPSPAPSDDGLIAFNTQNRHDLKAENPKPRVAVVPAAGGVATRLRKGSNPAWSPDGEKLVFQCYPRGICVMDPDGTNVERLTTAPEGASEEEPEWGPDGDIAFTRSYLDGERSRDIYIVRANGGKAEPMLTKGSNFSATWSPDGKSIAFIRGIGRSLEAPPGGFQLWTMAADGSNLQQLTNAGADRPDWSPDGRTIVFDAGSAIWTIPAKGGTITKLEPATTGHHVEGTGAFASWSPDGSLIVYTCQTGELDDNDLCVMNADGTGRTTILDTPANEASPAWQPTLAR